MLHSFARGPSVFALPGAGEVASPWAQSRASPPSRRPPPWTSPGEVVRVAGKREVDRRMWQVSESEGVGTGVGYPGRAELCGKKGSRLEGNE